jgi:hypothetical protein
MGRLVNLYCFLYRPILSGEALSDADSVAKQNSKRKNPNQQNIQIVINILGLILMTNEI